MLHAMFWVLSNWANTFHRQIGTNQLPIPWCSQLSLHKFHYDLTWSATYHNMYIGKHCKADNGDMIAFHMIYTINICDMIYMPVCKMQLYPLTILYNTVNVHNIFHTQCPRILTISADSSVSCCQWEWCHIKIWKLHHAVLTRNCNTTQPP